MALHCAATLVLVPLGVPVERVEGPGAVLAEPLAAGADAVGALQALADLHRGERVVVPVRPEHLAAVVEHLGRSHPARDLPNTPVRLEIGDDGWALVPAGG